MDLKGYNNETEAINFFVRELKNYNFYCSMIKNLEEKIELAWYELEGVKAIRYDKEPSTFNSFLEAERRNKISRKIEALEKDKENIERRKNFIDGVLNEIKKESVKESLIKVYCDGVSLRKIAKEKNISHVGLYKQIKKELLKALIFTA